MSNGLFNNIVARGVGGDLQGGFARRNPLNGEPQLGIGGDTL